MQTGDLLEWQGKRWLAVLLDRQSRLMTMLSEDGTRVAIPAKLDQTRRSGCVRLCNPAQDWPVIMRGQRARLGPMLTIDRTPHLGAPVEVLRPFYEWVLSDPERDGGGPIFFDPALQLQIGETLTARFERGVAKIVVPTSFSSLAERAAKAAAKPTEPRTAYDRLLDDDEDFGDNG